MADLDDFFAKKDKKKSKTKKFLTAEELAKKLEDTSKKTAELSKQKNENSEFSGGSSGYSDDQNAVEEIQEDEWKEFEQEERKDYTGLKLGQLTLLDDDNQSSSGIDLDTGTDTTGTDYEGNTPRSADKKNSGAWKKITSNEETTAPIQVEQEKPAPSKLYISPAFAKSRNQTSKTLKGRHRDAPDITNEEYFPTLGAARPEEQRKKKNEPAFEEVRHGSRVTHLQEVQKSSPISVGNRFKSLADDDS